MPGTTSKPRAEETLAGPSDLLSAVQAGDSDKVRKLLNEDPRLASARDHQGVSALMHAYYHRRLDIAALLLGAGPHLDLFEATVAGNAERVAEILNQDPSAAKAFSPDGFTALHLAAFFAHAEIARNLIRHGAEVAASSQNAMRVTPLHSAAAAHSGEIVRLLLENGAPVNQQQQGGWTALHAAADSGDREMVKSLVEYGADALIRNDEGKSPVDLARAKGYPELLELLQ